jgi:IMP cyclohydrolase
LSALQLNPALEQTDKFDRLMVNRTKTLFRAYLEDMSKGPTERGFVLPYKIEQKYICSCLQSRPAKTILLLIIKENGMAISREGFDPDTLSNNLAELRANEYTGRGIVVGRTATGNLLHVSWVTGRSEGSQNRRYVKRGNSVHTEVFDESKGVGDPELTIYPVMDSVWDLHVVTNGRQTSTVVDTLRNQPHMDRFSAFMSSIRLHRSEPDRPILTPRVSAYTDLETGASAISTTRWDELTRQPNYEFWRANLSGIAAGLCIHTYESDGNPPPTSNFAPYPVPVGENAQDTLDLYVGNIHPKNLVAAAVKEIDGETGKIEGIVLYNRHEYEEGSA